MTMPMIYYKDLRGVLQTMLLLPLLLLVGYILEEFIFPNIYHIESSSETLATSIVVTIVIMSGLLAAIAGARVFAEETAASTHLFLSRFPISKHRLCVEKIGAGLTALAILYALSIVAIYGLDLDEQHRSKPTDIGSIWANLAIITFTTYAAAIWISRHIAQPIAVVLAALTLESLLWAIASIPITQQPIDYGIAFGSVLLVVGVFTLPFLLTSQRWQWHRLQPSWGSSKWLQFRGLALKSFADLGLLNTLCTGLLIFTWLTNEATSQALLASLHPGYDPQILVPLLSALFVCALGALSYSTIERDAQRCILYNHPVPRSQLFVAKQVAALPALLAVFASIMLTRQDLPVFSLGVICLLIYTHSVQFALVLHRGTVIVLLGAMTIIALLIGLVALWVTPAEHYMFFPGIVSDVDKTLIATVPLAFVTFGVLISTYNMATSRRFLAGSERYRLRYFLVTAVVTGITTCAFTSIIQYTIGF